MLTVGLVEVWVHALSYGSKATELNPFFVVIISLYLNKIYPLFVFLSLFMFLSHCL